MAITGLLNDENMGPRSGGDEQWAIVLDHSGLRRLAKPDDIVDRLVRFRCGGEDRVLVALEHLDPMRNVSGVIVELGFGQAE